MEVIYPKETLDAIAKYDELINRIVEEYRPKGSANTLPRSDPDEWLLKLRNDSYYQACIKEKAKIISLSTCTYRFDASELHGEIKP